MDNTSPRMSCCGCNYLFQPSILRCLGRKTCSIGRNDEYWSMSEGITYCKDCFSDESSEVLALSKDGGYIRIPKIFFTLKKNVCSEPEPVITCDECHKQYHEICALYSETIFPEKYICDSCLVYKGEERKQKLTAKGLQESELSSYIEKRVNTYLKEQNSRKDVIIRVLTNIEAITNVLPQMKFRYDWPQQFPYHAKSIFAFQKFDGVDICFFGMFVQEYNSNCPEPNARRVYIPYIDTVPYCHFFEPKINRRGLYYEIILSYLDFVKQQGYLTAHIWTCPPPNLDDYIFRCHPFTQKMFSKEELQDWFKELFDKGVEREIIAGYKNFSVNEIKSISELPYFDEDCLPVVFEQCINNLNKETEIFQTKALLHVTKAEINVQDNAENISKWELVNYKLDDVDKRNYLKETEISLISKVSKALINYKKMSFVVNLHSEDTDINNLPCVEDPDPLNSRSDLFNRETLWLICQSKLIEFSTVRRAKYSTLFLLHLVRLCQVPICNQCKRQIDARYKCTVCNNFVLCTVCHESFPHNHSHPMEKLGLGLDEGDSVTGLDKIIVHVFSCFDRNCNLLCCKAKQKFMDHVGTCTTSTNNTCVTCRELNLIVVRHSVSCKDKMCKILFCAQIKRDLQNQQEIPPILKEEILQRKIDVMGVAETSKLQENAELSSEDAIASCTGIKGHCSAAELLQETSQSLPEKCTTTQTNVTECLNQTTELQENIQLSLLHSCSSSRANIVDCYKTATENVLLSLNELSLSLSNDVKKSNWCSLS